MKSFVIAIAIAIAIVISLVSCVRSICLENGRFPNNSASDCRGFTMCLKGAAGFMEYQLNCPENSIFSHTDHQCTNKTEYTCMKNYNCTKEEEIAEPSTCKAFISCFKDSNNIFSARHTQCPPNTAFNGSQCVQDGYHCPEKEKPSVDSNSASSIYLSCLFICLVRL